MLRLTICGSLILCLFTLPSLADNQLPLADGRYNLEGVPCERLGDKNAALLSNKMISIAETQCEFSEPKLIGDGEYSLKATCAQPELRAEFLNEAQLKIIATDRFHFDDGLNCVPTGFVLPQNSALRCFYTMFSLCIEPNLREPTGKTGQNGSADSIDKLMAIKL